MTAWKSGLSVLGLTFCLIPAGLQAWTWDLKGQASAWLALNDERPSTPRFGFRYIPTFSLSRPLGPKLSLDAEISLNAFATGQAPRWKDLDTDGEIKPYRLWVRFATTRFEARAGLQKINFGSASILRPLMWFDQIDPRDPLQVTDGVSGLLLRYYFPSNANVWLWGLYGNDDEKGWESNPSRRRTAEYGGRLQLPLLAGEIGFTYHHRRADLSRGLVSEIALKDPVVPEDRFGLDGKWDIGPGIWFEGSLGHQRRDELPHPYQRMLCIGADYTLGIANGLHVLTEHFLFQSAREALSKGTGQEVSALSLSYPLGLLDNISGIIFYDWQNRDTYRFLSWKRTYDFWQFYLIGFWNPAQSQIYRVQSGNNFFSGKGLQVMIVFNH
jgi:hypothetical protein